MNAKADNSLLWLQVKCRLMMSTLATAGRSCVSRGPLVAVPDTIREGCPEMAAIDTHRGHLDLLWKVIWWSQWSAARSAASCSTTRVLWRSTSWHTATNENTRATSARKPSRDRTTCEYRMVQKTGLFTIRLSFWLWNTSPLFLIYWNSIQCWWTWVSAWSWSPVLYCRTVTM